MPAENLTKNLAAYDSLPGKRLFLKEIRDLEELPGLHESAFWELLCPWQEKD
jgi:hypothetical protein